MNAEELKEYTDKEIRGVGHRIGETNKRVDGLENKADAHIQIIKNHEALCEKRNATINTHLIWLQTTTSAILVFLIGAIVYVITGQWPG